MTHQKKTPQGSVASAKQTSTRLVGDEISVSQGLLTKPTNPQISSTFRLIFVIAGQGTIVINTIAYPLQKNSLLWLGPYHTYFVASIRTPIDYQIIETPLNLLPYLAMETDGKRPASALVKADDVPIIHLNQPTADELRPLFATALAEYQQRLTHVELMLLGHLYQIIAIFLRNNLPLLPLNRNPLNTPWLIYHYIHEHFSEPLTITTVSQQLKLSPQDITTTLKALTNESFKANLTAIRMMKARFLLRFSQLSIDAIAKFIGYQSTPSFNRQFKKIMSMTPTDFRQVPKDRPRPLRFQPSTPLTILQYLFEHYPEPLTSTTLARAFNSHSKALNHLLYEEFGYTFSQLLTCVRMTFAKHLIVLTEQKIIDISTATGYNSLRSFNRHFKKTWHESPSSYRLKYGYFPKIKVDSEK